MYLLDTNIVSELRRPKPQPEVLDWIQQVPAERLHLSAVTIGEIQAGIEIIRRQDAAKAKALEAWLDRVLASYDVLPVDAAAFREWAKLMRRQSDTLPQDALIAAVAVVHGLIVATRNTPDFERLGVPILDPFTFHDGNV